jgi:hypothetical protein
MMSSMTSVEQIVESFTPAHPDLPRSAGLPALLGSESYVEALARVVYYWRYPGVDTFGRTNMWQIMKDTAGTMLGILPAGSKNHTGALSDYMSASQRWVVTRNNDTFYGAGFADLTTEAAVIQTPTEVPAGHYRTIQIVDVLTNVVHQLGSASDTPGGKFLLVGPGWSGDQPEGFIDVLRVPTNVAAVLPRSFAARSEESKVRARAVLDQIGMYPLSEDQPGQLIFGYQAQARNAIYPPGVTPDMIAANPDASRPQWVNAATFWTDLGKMLDFNPQLSELDTPMADQARVLVALHASDERYRALLDRTALAARGRPARIRHLRTDRCRRPQRLAPAARRWHVGFGLVRPGPRRSRLHLRRRLSRGPLPDPRHRPTRAAPQRPQPLHHDVRRRRAATVDRSRGGFWSLTMYDKDAFMLADAPLGRVNIGTVNLDANELTFEDDGTLTLHLGHHEPGDPAARTNWLPSPADQFCLIIRAYVPERSILDGSYAFPDVVRAGG